MFSKKFMCKTMVFFVIAGCSAKNLNATSVVKADAQQSSSVDPEIEKQISTLMQESENVANLLQSLKNQGLPDLKPTGEVAVKFLNASSIVGPQRTNYIGILYATSEANGERKTRTVFGRVMLGSDIENPHVEAHNFLELGTAENLNGIKAGTEKNMLMQVFNTSKIVKEREVLLTLLGSNRSEFNFAVESQDCKASECTTSHVIIQTYKSDDTFSTSISDIYKVTLDPKNASATIVTAGGL